MLTQPDLSTWVAGVSVLSAPMLSSCVNLGGMVLPSVLPSSFSTVQLLEKGEQNPSQISQDHHVTHSLLHVWWQLYRERREAACAPTQAFHCPPEVDRPLNAQELIAYLERPCGEPALERGSLLRWPVPLSHAPVRRGYTVLY